MKNTRELTEREIRNIAREESSKLISKEMDIITEKLEKLEKQGEILARLERLLLGEVGVGETETLRWKANFAYEHARKFSESRMEEKLEETVEWFKNADAVEKGESESDLQTWGKIIVLYRNVKWFFAILGITTLVNFVFVFEKIMEWIGQLLH